MLARPHLPVHGILPHVRDAGSRNCLRGLIPPFVWGNPPDINSVLHKRFLLKGDCSIVMVFHYLEWAFFWDTELPDHSRAFDCYPIPLLMFAICSLGVFSLITFSNGFLLPFSYFLPNPLVCSLVGTCSFQMLILLGSVHVLHGMKI